MPIRVDAFCIVGFYTTNNFIIYIVKNPLYDLDYAFISVPQAANKFWLNLHLLHLIIYFRAAAMNNYRLYAQALKQHYILYDMRHFAHCIAAKLYDHFFILIFFDVWQSFYQYS